MPSEDATRYFIVIEAVVVVVTLFAGFLSYEARSGTGGERRCRKNMLPKETDGLFCGKAAAKAGLFSGEAAIGVG
jgi:hypothetical protein